MVDRVAFHEKPRMGAFADKNGAYEQAFRVKRSVIKPGEALFIEQFFTGYGNIRAGKLAFYPSDDVFDEEHSYIQCDLARDDKGVVAFGSTKHSVKEVGVTFNLTGGAQAPSWPEATLFIDIGGGDPPQIMTEATLIHAPFTYNLVTSKSIRPGSYSLEFHFTYFNGDAWKSSAKKIEFKVQNFFERNDKVLGAVALIGTVTALMKFWLFPFLPGLPFGQSEQPTKARTAITRPASPPDAKR